MVRVGDKFEENGFIIEITKLNETKVGFKWIKGYETEEIVNDFDKEWDKAMNRMYKRIPSKESNIQAILRKIDGD